ncbi:hypothetical protein QUB70_30335 [Microcoleus sp. A003_D6]
MPIPQEKKFCGMGRRARPSYFCKRSAKKVAESVSEQGLDCHFQASISP